LFGFEPIEETLQLFEFLLRVLEYPEPVEQRGELHILPWIQHHVSIVGIVEEVGHVKTMQFPEIFELGDLELVREMFQQVVDGPIVEIPKTTFTQTSNL
jgi:hypothetical protein